MTGIPQEPGNNLHLPPTKYTQPPFERMTRHGDETDQYIGRIFYLHDGNEDKGVIELHVEHDHYSASFDTDMSQSELGRKLLDIFPGTEETIVEIDYEDGRTVTTDGTDETLFASDEDIRSFTFVHGSDFDLNAAEGAIEFTAHNSGSQIFESLFEASPMSEDMHNAKTIVVSELAAAQEQTVETERQRQILLQQLASGLGSVSIRIGDALLYEVGIRQFERMTLEEVGNDIKTPEWPEYEEPSMSVSEDGHTATAEFTLSAPGEYDLEKQLTRKEVVDLKKLLLDDEAWEPNAQLSHEAIYALAQIGIDLRDPSWALEEGERPEAALKAEIDLYSDPRVQYLMFKAAAHAVSWADGFPEAALRVPGGLWPKHMTPPATYADALERSRQFEGITSHQDEFWLGKGTRIQRAQLIGGRTLEKVFDTYMVTRQTLRKFKK